MWTIYVPHEDYPEVARAAFGTARTPRPALIEGYHLGVSFSLWMVIRALADAAWIGAAAIIFEFGLSRLGLPGWLPMWLAACLMTYVITLVSFSPYVYRDKSESWLRSFWRTYKYGGLKRASRMQTYLLVTLCVGVAIYFLARVDAETLYQLFRIVFIVMVFCRRLSDQIIMTSGSESDTS